jgi:hypothetical protein
MSRKTTIGKTFLLIVLTPLLFVFLLLLALGLPFYFIYRFFLRLAFEALVGAKGRRVLLVYSRSPVWQEYVETNWLPRIGDRAMVLNWSDRAKWKRRSSFAVWVFRHWAPSENFNPMAIVFPQFRPAKRVGFYYAFRDLKHGKVQAMEAAERQLFAYINEVQHG